MSKSILIPMFLFFCSFFLVLDAQVLLQNASYLDIEVGNWVKGNILIENGEIRDVNFVGQLNDDFQVINVSGKFIIPGLVDGHIHLFQSGGIYTRPNGTNLTEFRPYEEERKWLYENAGDLLKRYLRFGITTVVDIGGPMYNFELRDKYDDPELYPNLKITGPLVSTYQPEAFQIEDPPIIKVEDFAGARKMIDEQVKLKPDFIKIWYIVMTGASPEENFELIKNVIQYSHDLGLPVAVHATQLNTAKLSVKAGADFLVHSVSNPIDEEFIDMLIENEVSYIPTLTVSENWSTAYNLDYNFSDLDLRWSNPVPLGSITHVERYKERKEFEYRLSKTGKDRLAEATKEMDSVVGENLRKLVEAGVNVVTGTDAGNPGTLHATSYFKEISKMKTLGMTNLDILKSSTLNGYRMLGMKEYGKIAPDFKADLVILNDDPLGDIDALSNTFGVIKGGQFYLADSMIVDTPEDLAQRQLNAYNIQDIDAFLEPYSDDVQVYFFPNQLLYKGKDKMRVNYEGFFASNPNLHCVLENRIVKGNTVIDQEHVIGLASGESIDAIAIYKVNNGKIQKVYFIQ